MEDKEVIWTDRVTGQKHYADKAIPSTDSALSALFSQYALLRRKKDDLDMQLDKVDKDLAPIKEQIISLMTELEYQSINHDGVKYYLSIPARPSIIPEKRADFIAWLKGNGEEGIIQTDYVNSNTLWSWYNQREDNIKEELSYMLKVSEEVQLKSPKDYKRSRKKK